MSIHGGETLVPRNRFIYIALVEDYIDITCTVNDEQKEQGHGLNGRCK